MAKRFIDGDRLIEHLKDNIEECETPNVVNEPVAYGTVLGLECALSYAETLPTADVVEVRHGEWIWTENGEADYEQYWVCSVCGEKSYIETKYCSDCGAKMDGEKVTE